MDKNEKRVSFEIHESHLKLWIEPFRYAILMGGRGNGRSGTASRYTISQLLSKEYTRGAIMRAVREDIRTSCFNELIDRIQEQKIEDQFRITENDMLIERGRNRIRGHGFRASSGSLTARLKSLANYNFIWIEEAEEVGEEEFRKLDDTLRTKEGRIRIVLTLNTPAKNHWIIKKWFDLEPHSEIGGFYIPRLKELKDTIYIGGTWRENEPNLDEHTINRYQAYKQFNPSYYWQVIEGLSPDQVRGKIYSGWQQISEIPLEARLVKFGVDFGWFPDPACAVAIYYWNGSYIIDELAYGHYLTNEFLAQEIKKAGKAITVADSAEPKSIAEMNKYGISVVPCEKGKDSVGFRIKVVNQKKIYVTRRSKNVWENYENYKWREDKDGNPQTDPEHEYSHCFAPETLIYTTKGKKRIDKLVGKEGYLYSRNGKIKRFYNVRKTRENTNVISLTFDDGNILTITPDHLLLLPNGMWIEADLLRPLDMIQSAMYEEGRIQWSGIYKIFRQQLLQRLCEWKEMVFTSLCLVFEKWGNSQTLSYSSQGRGLGQQCDREFGVKTSSETFIGTYNTRRQRETKEMDKQNKTIGEQMAWVKRGNKISQMAWKEKLERKKTIFERMCSLPQKIQKVYQSFKRQILWKELSNESQTKTIIGITRGFCATTYNMEVEESHCLLANGVIAHNCMDAIGYPIASMHNKSSDIKMPRLPKQRVNIGL